MPKYNFKNFTRPRFYQTRKYIKISFVFNLQVTLIGPGRSSAGDSSIISRVASMVRAVINTRVRRVLNPRILRI